MVLLFMSAHHMGLEESLMREPFVADFANNVSCRPIPNPMCLSYMHFKRPLLGEDLAARFAHETDVVSSQIVLVQLKFERKGIVTNTAFKRTITTVICRDMMVQRSDVVEEPVAIFAWELRSVAAEPGFRSNPVFLDLMSNQRRPRSELKAADFAKGSRLRVLLRFALLQMTLQVVTVRVRPVAIWTAMRTNLGRGFLDAAGGRGNLFDFLEKDSLWSFIAVGFGFLNQFVLDEMSLLVLDETEQLAKYHRAHDAVESRREVGGHSMNGRHGFGGDPFVVDVVDL